MKRQIVSCGIFAMLLLASCNGAQQTSEVDLIDIAGGMEKLTELKVSDLGKTIRYIPLETTVYRANLQVPFLCNLTVPTFLSSLLYFH